MRMFGRPQGALGRLGSIIMARANYDCGAWVIELLEVRPNDRVLEVGFGSGVIIQRVAAVAACVAGVDLSQEMVEQARARNAGAVLSRRVELRRGSVESLPYDRNIFYAALAINSFQVWQNAGGWIARNTPSYEARWQGRARLYAIFGAVEEGADGNAWDCRLHQRANGQRRPWILRAGFKTRFS